MNATPIEILLVEDDDGDAKAVRRAFENARVVSTIHRVVDGVDALVFLRSTGSRQGPTAQLILLVDLSMPRMNGIQLIKELRKDKNLAKSIVFVLTTSKHREDMVTAYEHNVGGYIVKEKVGQDFRALVDLIEAYWRIVELP